MRGNEAGRGFGSCPASGGWVQNIGADTGELKRGGGRTRGWGVKAVGESQGEGAAIIRLHSVFFPGSIT